MFKPVRFLSCIPVLACGMAVSAYAQPLVIIDVPSPQTGPVLGYAQFSGWALDLKFQLKSVTILIDGIAQPVPPTYGVSRPDVCNAYPTSPDCQNNFGVGWRWDINTTLYASGSHLVEARATSVTGESATVTASFTVANWTSGTSDPMRISIDNPNGSQTTAFTGVAAFGGWALDDVAAITNVYLSVDGVFVTSATYGGNRPDVCAVFPGRPGCPNVGWNAVVDTTLLADGMHTLDVTVASAGGQVLTATSTFTVANFSSASKLLVDIDSPNSSSAAFSGSAAFGGWAVDLNGPSSTAAATTVSAVQILVDGSPRGYAIYGTSGGSRPDVCTALSITWLQPSCQVGWNYGLDTTVLDNGTHTLDVTAWATDGTHATLSTTFSVANAANPNNPTKLIIDRPNAQAPILVGTQFASGWALNVNAPINYVEIYVDGALLTNANYGDYRPDVCAVPAYASSPDCLNGDKVGWAFVGNTGNIPNGTHTLTAIAWAADGTHEIASTQFTVANWTTSGNPIVVNVDTPNSSSGNLSGSSVLVGGWAIDTAPGATITSVSVSVDGAPVGKATLGGNRADVCAVYTNVAGCPNVGWNFLLDTTQIPDGSHTLDITATSVAGESYTTTVPITILNNTSANTTLVDIDVPNANSGALSLYAPIGGWAISTMSGVSITAVNIYVDGGWVGTAGSNARPDVCAAFAQPTGCPNVGWNFELPTTWFENGSHTLAVVAETSNGTYATRSTAFSVYNIPNNMPPPSEGTKQQ